MSDSKKLKKSQSEPKEDSKSAAEAEPGSPDAVGKNLVSKCSLSEAGDEMKGDVLVHVGDDVKLRYRLCRSPGLLAVSFGPSAQGAGGIRQVGDAKLRSDQVAEIPVAVPTPGRYLAIWKLLPPKAVQWESLAEVVVNDVVRFRIYSGNLQPKKPIATLRFAHVEALP